MIAYFFNRQMNHSKNNIMVIITMAAIICTCLVAGCTTPITRQTADWCYAKDAISINIKSDSLLNMYDGYPHALNIAVIQVLAPDELAKMLEGYAGIANIIGNNNPIKDEVAFKRITLQPGEHREIKMDRAAGAQYIYLIFGYALDLSNKHNYLIPIPLKNTPQPLTIFADLGQSAIRGIQYTK